jgi:hypothetical protein
MSAEGAGTSIFDRFTPRLKVLESAYASAHPACAAAKWLKPREQSQIVDLRLKIEILKSTI